MTQTGTFPSGSLCLASTRDPSTVQTEREVASTSLVHLNCSEKSDVGMQDRSGQMTELDGHCFQLGGTSARWQVPACFLRGWVPVPRPFTDSFRTNSSGVHLYNR